MSFWYQKGIGRTVFIANYTLLRSRNRLWGHMRTRTSHMWKCVVFWVFLPFVSSFLCFCASSFLPFFLSSFLHFFAALFVLSWLPRFFVSSFLHFLVSLLHFLVSPCVFTKLKTFFDTHPAFLFLPAFLPAPVFLLILVSLILRRFLFDTYPRSVGATRLPSAELALPTSESPGSHWFLSISSQKVFEIWRVPSLAFWDRSLWYSWTFRSCDGEVTLRKKWCYTEQIGSLKCDLTGVEVVIGACLVAIDIATKSISVTVHKSTHDFSSSSFLHSRGRAFHIAPFGLNGHRCTCEIEWSICRTWDPMLLGCSLACRTVVVTEICLKRNICKLWVSPLEGQSHTTNCLKSVGMQQQQRSIGHTRKKLCSIILTKIQARPFSSSKMPVTGVHRQDSLEQLCMNNLICEP